MTAQFLLSHARNEATDASDDMGCDMSVFLTACVNLLREGVGQLEAAASTVSELVLASDNREPRLVVALQAFDRLKQELEALTGEVGGCAPFLDREIEDVQHGAYVKRAIDRISVGDLRCRLQEQMRALSGQRCLAGEVGVETEVDVEF